MILLYLHDLSIYPRPLRLYQRNLVSVPLILQLQYILPEQNRYLPIVLLPLKPRLIHKFNQPLHDRKDIVHVQPLQLEGLQRVGALHVDQGVADMLGDLYLLADLHLVVVFDLDLEVRGGDAPGDAADDLVERLQGGDADPEVACKEEDLVDLAQTGVVFGVVVQDLCHSNRILIQLNNQEPLRPSPKQYGEFVLNRICVDSIQPFIPFIPVYKYPPQIPTQHIQILQPHTLNTATLLMTQQKEIMQDTHLSKCLVCNNNLQTPSINICPRCTATNMDITEGIERRNVIAFCRFCKKYRGVNEWIYCQRYSRLHLAVLVRAVRGLKKVVLEKAKFIETEESSRYLKLQLTVGRWIDGLIKLQQTFLVQFYVANTQCQVCHQKYPPESFRAVVQIKQVDRRRKIIYFLQQLIIKQPKAYETTLKIGIQQDGTDFYFRSSLQAETLVRFIQQSMPVKIRCSKAVKPSLNGMKNIFIDIFQIFLPSVCKNDLVLFPPQLCRQLSISCPLLLCEKIGSISIFTDIVKLQSVQLTNQQFSMYQEEMLPYSLRDFGDQYIINSCSQLGVDKQKINRNPYSSRRIYNYTVSEVGCWNTVQARGFLGMLQPGTIVKGFDIEMIKHNERISFQSLRLPIILVRITSSARSRFRLKSWYDEKIYIQFNKRSGLVYNHSKGCQDMDDFLLEIEQDKYLQKDVLLYRQKQQELNSQKQTQQIVGLLDELNINTLGEEKPEEHLNFDDVCEIISKMQKITIEK